MIIWGSRGVTSVIGPGRFHCPQCDMEQTYSLKQVRNFFTLYFIPVIPLNIAGRFIECHSCGTCYEEEVLSYDPEIERAETAAQMLRIMVLAALADGELDGEEQAEIERQHFEFAGQPLTASALSNEIGMIRSADVDLNSYVTTLAPNLSPQSKALVVKLVFHTMSASSELRPGHQKQLTKLGDTLGIPQDQYMDLIDLLSEPSDEN